MHSSKIVKITFVCLFKSTSILPRSAGTVPDWEQMNHSAAETFQCPEITKGIEKDPGENSLHGRISLQTVTKLSMSVGRVPGCREKYGLQGIALGFEAV